MNKNHNKHFRILAIALSANGFGHAVMEGDNHLVDYRNKVFIADKNANSLLHINKLIVRYQPDMLVLHDVNARGTYRAPRIKELHCEVVKLAKKYKLKMAKLSNAQLRMTLLHDPNGTKHEMAEQIAKLFADELGSRVPPKRKTWTSEMSRMDIFDAMALAVVFRMKAKV